MKPPRTLIVHICPGCGMLTPDLPDEPIFTGPITCADCSTDEKRVVSVAFEYVLPVAVRYSPSDKGVEERWIALDYEDHSAVDMEGDPIVFKSKQAGIDAGFIADELTRFVPATASDQRVKELERQVRERDEQREEITAVLRQLFYTLPHRHQEQIRREVPGAEEFLAASTLRGSSE